MRVGIIGAGLQGRRRAPVVRAHPRTQLVVISAERQEHAAVLASTMGCEADEGWQSVAARTDLNIIVVCTPPHLHAAITIASLESGKHVLCEKPLARTVEEAEAMIGAAHRSGRVLKCGFNHRYHPGIQQVRRWIDESALGELIFARCRYGICGRPGLEREWRADPRIVGGGQLVEQGIHAIDLFQWFLGPPVEVSALTTTSFWNIAPLEDNALVMLRWTGERAALLHSSITQWRNLFSFELFGRDGYATVEGLGGSYGTQRASLGRRDFSAPFAEETIEYRGEDRSWSAEWAEFLAAIEEKREPSGSGDDGLRALRVVDAAYAAARGGRAISFEAAG